MSDAPLDLRAPFVNACKPTDQFGVGIEHEKVAVCAETLQPVPYEGERGIRRVLELMVERHGCEPYYDKAAATSPDDPGPVIAATFGKSSITLEPSGQVEWSGRPLASVHEACGEETRHLRLMKNIGEELGILWLSLGQNPLHTLDEMPWMPKSRYRVMRSYLPTRGDLALDMMLLTATVQANYDFTDLADLGRKASLATRVSPIVTALYANSPFQGAGGGKVEPNGFMTRRYHIWFSVDPDRCGLHDFMVDPSLPGEAVVDRYIEWALDAPLFFLERDGGLIEHHVPFRQFMKEGLGEHRATAEDWKLHLSTLFPEVRIKNTIEVRGADSCSRERVCALASLFKGLLYDPDALDALENGPWARLSHPELVELQHTVAERGLEAEIPGGGALAPWARELLEISDRGLGKIGCENRSGEDERHFLEPLFAIAEEGRSPAAELLERWKGEWQQDPRRMVTALQYR